MVRRHHVKAHYRKIGNRRIHIRSHMRGRGGHTRPTKPRLITNDEMYDVMSQTLHWINDGVSKDDIIARLESKVGDEDEEFNRYMANIIYTKADRLRLITWRDSSKESWNSATPEARYEFLMADGTINNREWAGEMSRMFWTRFVSREPMVASSFTKSQKLAVRLRIAKPMPLGVGVPYSEGIFDEVLPGGIE